MSELVLKPEDYIKNEVGYHNKYKIEKAIEIYLAKVSLIPDYDNFKLDSNEPENLVLKEWLNKTKENYEIEFKDAYETNSFKTTYFFHFVRYSYTTYLEDKSVNNLNFNQRVLPYIAFRFLKEKHSNNELTSIIARTMFNRDQFYKKTNKNTLECFNNIIEETESSKQDIKEAVKRIEAIMIVQHRELYELEQEMVGTQGEHDYFEQFINDFHFAVQSISNDIVFI